jgi:hypothetical protein
MSSYGEELFGGGLYGGPAEGDVETEDDSWTVIAGAIIDTVAYGPVTMTDLDGIPIDSPGSYVIPLELELVDINDIGFVMSRLPHSFSRSFQDDSNNTGTASFAIENGDVDWADVTLERLVNFKVYGNRAMTMLIESQHKVAVAEGEEFDQITVNTGRGHLALWEQFVLYPSRGPDSVPVEEDRVFNWTSPTYDDTTWKMSKHIAKQGGSSYWIYNGVHAPFDFPDATAYWIWAKVGTQYWAPPGVCYFRRNFTVPSGVTSIAIYYSMDNRGKIYVDGIPYAEQPGGMDLQNTKYVTIDVTPGPHLIAVEVFNEPKKGAAQEPTGPSPTTYTVQPGDTLWGISQRYYGDGRNWRIIYDKNKAQIQADATTAGLWDPYDPGHWIFPGQVFIIPGMTQTSRGRPNPGGLIIAIYEQDEEPTNLLAHTDANWRVVAYPDEPPGMTVVIRRVKAEASRRGNDLADMITLKFTDDVDSAGNSWPVHADIASKVATDYLTFLLELTAKYADVWMAPGTLDFYAWDKGTRSSLRDIALHTPTDPQDPETGNLFGLTHTVLV